MLSQRRFWVPAVAVVLVVALLVLPETQRGGGDEEPRQEPVTDASGRTCERPSRERLELLDEAVGFGRNATGGRDGCLYRVTNLNDSGEGSLREAASVDEPAWIVFDVSGVIRLDDHIRLNRDTTIDGRGASIALEGAGLLVIDTPNVIVSDIEVRGSGEDGFQIRGTATHDIWVHHVLIWDIRDGYVDITQGATDVTVSWSHFAPSDDREKDKTLLVGTGEPGFDDANSRVTLHHNYFDGTQQRNPLIRVGSVHSFNNYFHGWGLYASGVDAGGSLLSEANIYAYGGVHNDRAFLVWGEGPGYIRSVDDTLLDGAKGRESDPDEVPDPPYRYRLEDADDDLAKAVSKGAGPRG